MSCYVMLSVQALAIRSAVKVLESQTRRRLQQRLKRWHPFASNCHL